MSDPIEIRRQRLLYQSKRRGTKEADMIIGQFAIDNLHLMTSKEDYQWHHLFLRSHLG